MKEKELEKEKTEKAVSEEKETKETAASEKENKETSEKEEKASEKKKDPKDEKIDELNDKLKRSMAEFDNYRKRTDMEKSIAVERVLEVAGMLPLRIENKEKEKAHLCAYTLSTDQVNITWSVERV